MDSKQESTQSTTPQPTPAQQPVASEQSQQPTTPTDTTNTTSAQPAPASSIPPEAPPKIEKEDKQVSLRTVLLIVFLAILAAVLLFIALKPAKKAVVQNTATSTTKPSQAHSTLSLVLADTTATPSGLGISTKSVNVVLTTQTNKVEGVQFEIAYDPTVLTNVTVKPGDFFTNPLTLLNQVDQKNGKINFATGIQPTANPITGSGTVAIISYTLLPTASASQTTLKFLPKTQVIQQGTLGSVLEKSFDLSIPVAGLTPSATK